RRMPEICSNFEHVLLIVSPAIFDGGVAALDDACFAQAAAERRQLRRESARRCRSKHADGRHVRLLPVRRERPRTRAAEQRDELAAVAHSITSSARASNGSGNERASVLAVLMLSTSSILTAC